MLRDNLKAARVESEERNALQNEVAELKNQLSEAAAKAKADGRNPSKAIMHDGAKPRCLSEDGATGQSQVWLQLVNASPQPCLPAQRLSLILDECRECKC
jgi:Tfp pilus assembly protein FimT